MNKRSIIFVIALMGSMFFINSYFAKKEATAQPQSKETSVLHDEAASSLPIASLPLSMLYRDDQGMEAALVAFSNHQQYLALSGNDAPDATLYIKNGNSFSPVVLRFSTDHQSLPLIYSADMDANLSVAKAPFHENIAIQILTFGADGKSPELFAAEMDNGNVYFPGHVVDRDGIALVHTQKGFLPYGIFKAGQRQVTPLNDYSQLQNFLSPEKEALSTANDLSDERFYVLENDLQQVVFSNVGGAVSEINLALYDKAAHSMSAIRPISIDRALEKKNPANNRFPSFPYSKYDETEGKIVEMANCREGGYYPLLRRSIIGFGQSAPAYRISPKHYAFNILSSDPASASTLYQVKKLEKDRIEFEAVLPNRKITKTYTLSDQKNTPYCLELAIKIEGDARGLSLTSGVPEVELVSGNFSPSLKYRFKKNLKSVVEKLTLPKQSSSMTTISPEWVCNSNGFLGIIMDPVAQTSPGVTTELIAGDLVPTRLSLLGANQDLYPASKYPGYQLQLPLSFTSKQAKFRIFAGPFEHQILSQVDDASATEQGENAENPDYVSAQSSHGWFSFISEPFAKFLFYLMNLFYQMTGSWGFSIILLTIALRLMMYPLNAWSIKSSLKMQQIAPEVASIQARYKKDPKRAQLEVMNLYRERGVNPLTGCFPILIQMPFLIGMFDLLKSTFALRGASFIPGWIDNLTAPDVLFSWSYPIPFFGTQFHLLPIILGCVMFFQQRMTATFPKDPSQMTDQQRQQKVMGNIMVIVFTVMFYHFPSGLNIYWLSSMLLGMLQQWWMTKRFKNKAVTRK